MKLFLLIPMFLAIFAKADSEFESGFPEISSEAMLSRILVRGELFITDGTGKILRAPTTDIRQWRPGIKGKSIESEWITKGKGIRDVIVRFSFDFHDDKSIKVSLKQYDSFERGSDRTKNKYGKLLHEESYDLENFAPISYVAEATADHRVILRFMPDFETLRDGTSLDKITIGGDRNSFLVTDNHGYVWAEPVRFGGVISGLKSHRGSFVMSLYPFKGAKEMGFAAGKTIELNLTDKLRVSIRNEEEVVPEAMKVKVYAIFMPNLKSGTFNSHYSFGQEKVEQVPKEFGL
jgi:hypothetical protein